MNSSKILIPLILVIVLLGALALYITSTGQKNLLSLFNSAPIPPTSVLSPTTTTAPTPSISTTPGPSRAPTTKTTPVPTIKITVTSSPQTINFDKTGNLTRNVNRGSDWYLTYEEPGAPALNVKINILDSAKCTNCQISQLKIGDRIQVKGHKNDSGIDVASITLIK